MLTGVRNERALLQGPEAEHGVTEPCLLVSQVTELDPRNADGQCAVT